MGGVIWAILGSLLLTAIQIFLRFGLLLQKHCLLLQTKRKRMAHPAGVQIPHKKRKKKPVVSSRVPKCKRTNRTTCKGFKSFPSSRYNLSLTDPHRYCLKCLGRKHDMTICNSCLSLSKESFHSQFIRHYLWSILPPVEGLPDKPPSSRVSTKTNSQAIIELDGKQKFRKIVGKATDHNKEFLQKFPLRESLGQTLAFPPPCLLPLPSPQRSEGGIPPHCHLHLPHPPLPPPHPVGRVNAAALQGVSLEARHHHLPSTDGLRGTE